MALFGAVALVVACADPAGPPAFGVLTRLDALGDTVIGAPGRALPQPVVFQLTDGSGAPVPEVAVRWTVVGTNGHTENATDVTDAAGRLSAVWVLGTHASESQQLSVEVTAGKLAAQATIQGTAQPVDIAALAVRDETTTVHLGVPTRVVVQATDPFGNTFVPASARFTCAEATLCRVDSLGIVQGLKRGWTMLLVSSESATDTAWVHTTQTVAAIVPSQDTLRFHSLGQTATLQVQIVDDHGLPVMDSFPVIHLSVDTVVQVQPVLVPRVSAVSSRSAVVAPGATLQVSSLSQGRAAFTLSAGDVTHTIATVVHQHIQHVSLSAGRTGFDALGDTSRLVAQASDSLGAPVVNPSLALWSADTTVATVGANGLVTSRRNGAVWMYSRADNGIADSIRMVVAQQVARIAAVRDSLLLEALHAVLPLRATAFDRLGSPVADATLAYVTGDASVVTVDSTGDLRASGNGSTIVRALAGTDTAAVIVRVAQRAVRVAVPSDTVRFVALGDSQAVTGTAFDSLGSVVPGLARNVTVGDTNVVSRTDSTSIRSRGNGLTEVNFTVASFPARVVMLVQQIPTTLTASVTFGNPVLTLPAGSSLPLACQGRDKNGFAIPQDPTIVRSVRGTVSSGAPCHDVRVQRSGYDTLIVGMGSIQTRLPVVVATAPDSVGILAAASTLTTVQRDLYVGENLENPLIVALHPLVADILASYGNPTTNLDRARALRDWVSRTAVHPYSLLHPNGSSSNLTVLPTGVTWADVNAAAYPKIDQDTQFWGSVGLNGYAMLDSLLGTLDPSTGQRAANGMMVQVAGSHYQIRDIASFHYVLCSYQDIIFNTMLAAAGLQGMLINTLGHDPAAVFIPEMGRWIYEDPEWDEEYALDGMGDPLSPTDLLTLSSSGQGGRLQPRKLAGPSYDPTVYVAGDSYIAEDHANGMVIMGSQLNNQVVGIVGSYSWPMRYVQIDVPQLALEPPYNDPVKYAPVSATDAFPTLGVVVQQVQTEDSVYVAHLSSTLPNHQHFERRVDGGAWSTVSAVDVLPVGQCRVEYRSVDAMGNVGATSVLDVWVPRAPGFIDSGVAGSMRTETQLIIGGF